MQKGKEKTKVARVNVYAKDAVHVTAKLDDFDGDVSKWKIAVYELFRYDMTYSFAHKIDVIETSSGDVIVSIIIKPAFEEAVMATMMDLGFKNVIMYHDDIGTIECTEMPDDMLFDYVEIDY